MNERTIGFIQTMEENAVKNRRATIVPMDFRHALCAGTTGSGKTESLVIPTLNDRIERGNRIVFYAYKGREHQKIKMLARNSQRLQEVVEIGKPYGHPINLMEAMNLDDVEKVIFELCGGSKSNSHDYWALSAAAIGRYIAGLLRAMHRIYQAMESFSEGLAEEFFCDLSHREEKRCPYRYIGLASSPSFAQVYKVVQNAQDYNRFFKKLRMLVDQLSDPIAKTLKMRTQENHEEISCYREYLASVAQLQNEVAKAGNPLVSEDQGEATGNSGVRQVLENGLRRIAGKEYLNRGSGDILATGEIIVIDVEGIEQAAHGVLMNILLRKLAARTREDGGSGIPYSIFIDEANRVLPRELDLYNDVLREAKVELILAYQNDAQMIGKFGSQAWEAAKGNFLHRYEMEPGYQIVYTMGEQEEKRWKARPLSWSDEDLLEAEREYNYQEKILETIRENFFVHGKIPSRYHILYDPQNTAAHDIIELVDESGKRVRAEYLGQEGMKFFREMNIEGTPHQLLNGRNEDSGQDLFSFMDEKDSYLHKEEGFPFHDHEDLDEIGEMLGLTTDDLLNLVLDDRE